MEVVNRKCFAILISTLICFVLYYALIQTWTNHAEKYVEEKRIIEDTNIITFRNALGSFGIQVRLVFSSEQKKIGNGEKMSSYRERSCNNFMELSSPGGRIGNQLFQIAALFGISCDYDYIPIVKPPFPLLRYFDLPNVFMMKLRNPSVCAPQYSGIFYECSNSCKNDKCTNMTIYGFFQSWKYFKNSADVIRTVLKIRDTYMQTARRFLEVHKKVGFKNISIHVRRTDMANELHQRKGFAVATVNFIHKAINFCEATFKKAIKRDVKFSSFKEPGYDLALMTLCDHVVVTAGSFGCWGAWLSNGTAVYINGYPRPGSLQDERFLREDYYPPNWIGLSS